MTKNEAFKCAIRANPKMKIISGIEYSDVFGFNMVPQDMQDNDFFGNNSLCIVYKNTGKTEWISSEEIIKKWSWPPLKVF